MNADKAVDKTVEQEIEAWQAEQEYAQAHRYHMEFKPYCLWCIRGRL